MIIGISGKIGAGKTELAKLFYVHYGYEPKIFAAKLKKIAAILTGLSVSDMYDRKLKDRYLDIWQMTLGELQQKLGTEAIRDNLHIDAWVNALFADYDGTKDWSISDVRFLNEAQRIHDMGGIVIRIDGSRTGPGGRDPNHISEVALDDYEFDYRFTNNGTLSDLAREAYRIVLLAHGVQHATLLTSAQLNLLQSSERIVR